MPLSMANIGMSQGDTLIVIMQKQMKGLVSKETVVPCGVLFILSLLNSF